MEVCQAELDLGEDVFYCEWPLGHPNGHFVLAGEFVHIWFEDGEMHIYHVK